MTHHRRALRQACREWRDRRPAAVVIVSYPKSGRTWFRVMLGRAVCRALGVPESVLLDTRALTEAAGLLPTVFSHDGSSNTEARHYRRLAGSRRAYRNKRVLFLCRDPRDVVVSCFFQATSRRYRFDGGISEFVRDPHYGIRKVMTFHRAWYEAREVPQRFEVIRYEEIHADPGRVLRIALEMIGMDSVSEEIVADATAFAAFDRMREMEREQRFESKRLAVGRPDDPESYKVRRGRIGGYADYLGADDVAYCDRVIAEFGGPFAGWS